MKLKVIAVSTNANDFGLYNVVLIGTNGRGYSGLMNAQNCPPKDTVYTVKPAVDVLVGLADNGFECPTKLESDPDQKVMQQVWGDEAQVDVIILEYGLDVPVHQTAELMYGDASRSLYRWVDEESLTGKRVEGVVWYDVANTETGTASCSAVLFTDGTYHSWATGND